MKVLHRITTVDELPIRQRLYRGNGYWQVTLERDSIQKSEFITCEGLYEFLVLPFGLNISVLDGVLRDLKEKLCFIYIDDIVVYFPSVQQHFHHLQEVFEHLHQAGLMLSLKKCNLLQTSLTFLGHMVSREGISMEPSKVEVEQDFLQPQSVKEVQRFLEMAGWYHWFIPHFAERDAVLKALKKNVTWAWSE
ncbi:hypothetical protein SRHO_G00251000 [Serrasalmus rhombeus]